LNLLQFDVDKFEPIINKTMTNIFGSDTKIPPAIFDPIKYVPVPMEVIAEVEEERMSGEIKQSNEP